MNFTKQKELLFHSLNLAHHENSCFRKIRHGFTQMIGICFVVSIDKESVLAIRQ